MKKSAILTSKRTFDRKLKAKIEEIRTAENNDMSSFQALIGDNHSEVGQTYQLVIQKSFNYFVFRQVVVAQCSYKIRKPILK